MPHEIIQLIAEDHDNFITVIANHSTKEAIVVDPAWDAEGILETLKEEKLNLTAILITHSHYDHINAVSDLYSDNISLFISESEYPYWKDCPEDAILLQDGDEIQFGNESIKVIYTPGHTPGACCYLIGNDLITGDTLFIYGCGRADLPNGDVNKLYHSLQKLKKLPPNTKIWVGHNYSIKEESTIADQLKGNPFLMIDNLEDFARYRLDIAKKARKMPYDAIDIETLKQSLLNH